MANSGGGNSIFILIFGLFYFFIQDADSRTTTLKIEIGHGVKANRSDPFVLICGHQKSKRPEITSVIWEYRNYTVLQRPNNPAKTWVYFKSEKEYNGTGQVKVHLNSSESYSSLNFGHKAMPSDAGNYTCYLKNATNGAVHTCIYLLETSPFPEPESARQLVRMNDQNFGYYRNLTSYILQTGSSETIRCSATGFKDGTGFTKPRVTWKYIANQETEEKLIEAEKKTISLNDPSRNISSDGYELRLNNIQKEHRGYYVCVADNSINPPLEIYHFVRVKDRLAPLWPLLALIAEIVLLVLIIVLCECYHKKYGKDEDIDRTKAERKSTRSVQNRSSTTSGSGQLRQRPPATSPPPAVTASSGRAASPVTSRIAAPKKSTK